jgi:hypothetical protein
MAPALLLGIAIWVHLSAAFLVPSLIYLILHGALGRARKDLWLSSLKSVTSLAAPFAVFLFVMVLAGHLPRIQGQFHNLLGFMLVKKDPMVLPAIIPFFEPRIFRFFGNQVIQYHFLSRNHLLFLLNSNFILSPFGLPCLGILFPVFIKRKWSPDPTLIFLLIASLFMLVYSMIIYPVYWAYDWDLFSMTAFCYTMLTAYLFYSLRVNRKIKAYLLTYFSAFSLFFITIPFVLLNSMDHVKDAGAFSKEIQPFEYIISTMGNPDQISK